MSRRLLDGSLCLLLALVGVGCGEPPSPPQVVLIAVDGLEPSLLEDLLDRRQLPHIQGLVDRGSLARIKCVTAMISPVVWTTVATGMAPEEHGITGFELAGTPVRTTDRKVPAFWNLYSNLGLSTALVGWMVSWPAERESGLIVSDRAHYGDFERKQAPEDLVDLGPHQIRPRATAGLDRFTTFDHDPDYVSLDPEDPAYEPNFLVDRRLNRIVQRDTAFTSIAVELLETRQLDLLALYLRGIDYVSHGFWKYYDPEPFRREGWVIDPELVSHLGPVIPAYYAYLDELVGRLLAAADRDALVILLSDHGFGTALGPFRIQSGDFLSGNHRDQGVLILSGTGAQRGVTQTRQITHYDILPTLLWVTEHPQAKDFRGRPLIEYLTERFSDSASLPMIASYRDVMVLDDEGVGATAEDEGVLEELRSLGYID